MISDSVAQSCMNLVQHLFEPAIRSMVVAGMTALGLVLARVRKPALRLAVWTSVLYAALAMPFLGVLLPAITLPLPVPFVARPASFTPVRCKLSGEVPAPIRLGTEAEPRLVSRSFSGTTGRARLPLAAVAVGFYTLGVAVGLMRLGLGLVLTGRLRGLAREIRDSHALALLSVQTRVTGLSGAPKLAESAAVVVPVTIGLWSPAVLLPGGWREWDEPKLHAVLAHELSHVARGDFLTQTLAALHRCFFWFSPLAWWLECQLAELSEQSSDDAALESGAKASDYAEALLGFLGARDHAQGRVRWNGVEMARGGKARRRLERILSTKDTFSGGIKKAAWLTVGLCTVPLTCVVAAVRPSIPSAVLLAPSTASVQALAATSPNPPQEARGSPQQPEPAASGKLPAPPTVPVPPQAPAPDFGRGIRTGSDSYIFICCGGEFFVANTDNHEVERIKALRARLGMDIIWVRHGGKPYLIRDEATLRKAREIWTHYEVEWSQVRTTLAELGLKQAQLGVMHAELGERKTEALVEDSDLADQLKKVEEQVEQLHKGSSPEQFNEAQAELILLQAKLRQLQAKSEEQRAGDAQQEPLFKQNAQLEKEQKELMERGNALGGEASQRMAQLMDDAFAHDLAQPEAAATVM